MVWYIASRFLRMITVVWAVSLLSFVLLNLIPGNPVVTLLGPEVGNAHAAAQLTAQLGLNHPIIERYFIWLGHVLQGNLGYSYVGTQSVSSAIFGRLPITLEIMLEAEILSLVVSMPLAMLCALRPGKFLDSMVNRISLGFLALPAFMLGPILVLAFAVKTHIFPATGVNTWFQIGSGTSPAIIATPGSLVLPSIILAVGQIAVFTRVLKGDLVTTLKSEFILFARSKGLSTTRILVRHALRPSSISLASLVGLSIGGLLAGALIVENIFAIGGMGTLLVTSIEKHDYLMVQGIVLVVASGFVTINFLTDAVYSLIDPRIRRGRRIG